MTALTAFEERAGIMKRFSREAEKLVAEAAVSSAGLLKQFQWPGVAVTAKAIPMASAPWGTNRGSPARRPAAVIKNDTHTAFHRSIIVRHNYCLKFMTGKGESQEEGQKKVGSQQSAVKTSRQSAVKTSRQSKPVGSRQSAVIVKH